MKGAVSCQFALPKSLSVAKLCINVMFAMVGGRYSNQIFGIKLMSHLSCQFALPKSLSVAKLCINVMFAMVGGRYSNQIFRIKLMSH